MSESTNKNQHQVKAVIFDMDGVLIDTEKHLIECWMEAAKMYGFTMKREEACLLRSLSAVYAEPLLKKMYGETFDYHKIRETRKHLMQQRLEKYGIERKPGVKEALKYLKECKIKTAVATATDLKRAEKYLEDVGILHDFSKIITAQNVLIGKPDPEIYRLACRELGEDPKDCIAVEDSPNGIKSAHAAGMRVIMVPDLTDADNEVNGLLFAKIETLKDLHRFV